MKATIYIPYANGDCVRGFKHNREISAKEYVSTEVKDYREHKVGVDAMMPDLGMNIAVNPFTKEKRAYKPQTYYYHKCPCVILNIEGRNMTTAELDECYRSKSPFVVIMTLDRETYDKKPDMVTDLNSWFSESGRVTGCPHLTDEQAMEYLPKKDFRIAIDEDNSTAVLKDCKFSQLMGSRNTFAVIVDKVVFVKE